MRQTQIAVIVVAFGATGALLLFRSDGSETLPDTPDSRTQWQCHSCKHSFSLTAAQAQTRARLSGAWSPLGCLACGKPEAYRVAACRGCGGLFFGPDVPGESGACPRCSEGSDGTGFGNQIGPLDGANRSGEAVEVPASQEQRPPPVM